MTVEELIKELSKQPMDSEVHVKYNATKLQIVRDIDIVYEVEIHNKGKDQKESIVIIETFYEYD